MSRLEMAVVIAAIVLLALLLLSSLSNAKSKSARISCNCRLKQIGLAARIWSGGEWP
jgi:hypothetical protein